MPRGRGVGSWVRPRTGRLLRTFVFGPWGTLGRAKQRLARATRYLRAKGKQERSVAGRFDVLASLAAVAIFVLRGGLRGGGNAFVDNGTLVVVHGAGFFSCCSVRLDAILAYVGTQGCAPTRIDGRLLFDECKPPNDRHSDVCGRFFGERAVEVPGNAKAHARWPGGAVDCRHLDFDALKPFVERFFTPSREVRRAIRELERKYGLTDYGSLCAVYYRGTDKRKETELPSYCDVLEKAREIAQQHAGLQFLVQSDDTGFLAAAETVLPSAVTFTDENLPRGTAQGFQHALWLLSIVVIMSRCRFLVCTSGNVSIWTVLFRGHTSGVVQYLKQRRGARRNTGLPNLEVHCDHWIYGDGWASPEPSSNDPSAARSALGP